MTTEQAKKLSAIFRRAFDAAKCSIDSFAQLADDALEVLSEPEEKRVSNATERGRAPQPERKFLNKKELAERLNVSPRTISNLQNEGLPPKRIRKRVLFDYEEVLIWIDERENENNRNNKLRVVK